MTGKFALLIGNSQYQDPILARLKAPDSDVSELTTILEDPSIGDFDQVIPIFSESSTALRVAIGDFFAEKRKDDLLLLYFSGHGVLDENGRLYLAVRDTQHNRLSATAIPASFIKDEMENCRSRRQVLILDCCHSGAFSRGKGLVGLNAITRATFEGTGGYGQIVITATDATQYALEGDQVIGNVETSLFTHFMIEGLRTGQADSDRDGRITVDELYDYVYEQVGAQTPHQTPRKWEQAREGEELVIARSRYRPTDLPTELRQAIESTIPNVREGVVRDLGHLLRGSDKSLARLARGILKAMSKEDDSLRVRNAALAVLKDYEERKTAKDRPRPSVPSPLERTQPTKPIPIQLTARKGTSNQNPSQTKKLPKEILAALVQGILGLIGVALTAYITYIVAFAPRGATQTPEVSTMTSVETSIASSSAIVTTPFPSGPMPQPTSAPTYTPYLIQTPYPTPVLPTVVSLTNTPTSTLVPAIIVPSNTLTHTLTPIPILPTLTPIGGGTGKIAFTSDQNGNYEIYVMNVDGSGLINLTNNSAIDTEPSWSPDGKRIAFNSTRDDPNPSTCAGQCIWGTYVMNADGTNPTRLINNGLSNGGASWSPDGRKIAFIAGAVGDISGEEIYVMNADGSNLIKVTQNSTYDFDPSWSPDGTKIAFCSGRDGNPDIYVMNADGSGQINLTNYGAADYYPQWSPDGRKITFSSIRDGNYEIYMMNADGSGLMRLTQNSWIDHYASWSPDGNKIVFASSRDDPGPTTCAEKCQYKIYMMNPDGSNQIRVANYYSSNPFPMWSP